MANIVLLSDGTGNSAAKFFKTNVWRTYQALDLRTGSGQVACYDDGVGTSNFKPLELLGGALGLGLQRNVRELYAFACRNYNPGDRIFAFGFSRGAYTIRVLGGMIAAQGLVDARGMHAGELEREAARAYNADRADYKTKWKTAFRDRASATSAAPAVPAGRIAAPIAFLGLWDTVDAYGMPVDELKRGLDYWLLGLSFPDQDLSPVVERACHALALDDERRTFHPVLWNERFDLENPGAVAADRLKQVWFTGMHANVGGGYGKDGLSYVSLLWMLREAQAAGLALHPQAMAEFQNLANAHADMADSRAGLAAYYRYDPRRLSSLCNDRYNRVFIERPKVHHSVLERIREQQVEYVPHVLPAAYDVVDAQGAVVSSAGFESADQARERERRLESAWDLVWWRRLAYFATLGLTFALAALPWFGGVRETGGCTGGLCFLEPVFDAIGAFLPSALDSWMDAYRRNMTLFAALAVPLGLSLWLGKRLERRIARRSAAAWSHVTGANPVPPDDGPFSALARFLRTSRPLVRLYRWLARDALPFLWVALLLVVAFFAGNRLLHDLYEATGFLCKPSAAAPAVPEGGEAQAQWTDLRSACFATGIALDEGYVYTVRLKVTAPWKDRTFDATPRGFGAFEPGTLVHVLGVPGRRAWFANWFAPILRIGPAGHDRRSPAFFPVPGDKGLYASEPFYARTSGELFLYVNDVILAVPGITGYFYGNNSGTAEVVVSRVHSE